MSESGRKGLGLVRVEDGAEMNQTERVTRVESRGTGWRTWTLLMEQHSWTKKSTESLRLGASGWRREAEKGGSPDKDIQFAGKIQTG